MPIEKANVILVRWISSRSELRRRSHPKGVGRPEYGNASICQQLTSLKEFRVPRGVPGTVYLIKSVVN
jgi:hypothetical protein